MILLGVIIVASVFGTFVESGFNATVARNYVYDAPWFIAWLLLLCTNLIAAVMARYPWKPHQWGFVTVHAGIVVILVGGIIGRIWGIEGNMTLVANGPPQNFLVVNESLLQVQKAGERPSSFSLKLNLRKPEPEKPLRFKAGDIDVTVLQVADELGIRQVVEPAVSGGSPALRLVMIGDAAPHPIDQWLVQGNPQRAQLALGRNLVRFASEEDSTYQAVEHATSENASREVHFAFGKMSGMNVSRVISGHESRATAIYRFESSNGAANNIGVLTIHLGGRDFAFTAGDILGRAVPLEGTDWTLHVLRYFSDFRMQGKEPVNASDEPNNPALVLELSGPAANHSEEGCCPTNPSHEIDSGHDHNPGSHQHSGHSVAAQNGAPENQMTFRYDGGRLFYESQTANVELTCEVEVGEEFSAGWTGWRFRVEEILENATLRDKVEPMAGAGMRSIGASGLLVHLEREGHSVERWLEMGKMTFVPLGNEPLHLGFGFRLHPLDFKVELERFEVEFNAGTQTPASFKSHVVFTSESGDTLSRAVWMNNPTNFPNFMGAGFLGTSYKFSQSSWNPGDHSQTTLQVIRDPGWSLKWIGSLLFCLGLLTIFYLKSYPRFKRDQEKAVSAIEERPARAVQPRTRNRQKELAFR